VTTLALLLAAAAAAAAPVKVPPRPADLGPKTIDVSSYPAELQRTYRETLLPLAPFLPGGSARLLNSPLIEIDPAGEAALRKAHPELFADPRLAVVGPDVWRREALRLKNRPPCCGACPILSMAQARALWKFFAYDSLRRKTGDAAPAWAARRRELIAEFDRLNQGLAAAPSAAGPGRR
jgi:hypothetical protein